MRCVVCLVAGDAKSHRKFLWSDNAVHLLHVSMAVTAINAPVYVLGMLKLYEVRQYIDSFPSQGDMFVIVPPKFLNIGISDDNPGMAQHTCLHRRNARMGRRLDSIVAHEATDGFYPRMDAMAERQRLFDAKPDSRCGGISPPGKGEENHGG